MSAPLSILSAGLDAGTTTILFVFSRLEVVNAMRPGLAARLQIGDRTIEYQPPVIFTPLLDNK